jgi:monofunctional biosynthetic peptidoglycan transglycosylase
VGKKGRGARPGTGFVRLWALRIGLGLGGLYLLCCLGLVYLRWFPPVTTMVQIQRRLEAIGGGRTYHSQSHWQPLSRISPNLQHAVIAAEDGRFFQHHGIDWKEVEKVMDEDFENGRPSRGASTIDQQLVKNLFLTTHRWAIRKAAELALLPAAEIILPKHRMLELYLNVIEWGPGIYGAEAAAEHHYHVPAAQLSRDQAARLAACIPAPRKRKPAKMNSFAAAIEGRMHQQGW